MTEFCKKSQEILFSQENCLKKSESRIANLPMETLCNYGMVESGEKRYTSPISKRDAKTQNS